MEKVLIIAEHHHHQLAPSTKATLGAGKEIAAQCDVLLVGPDDRLAQEIAQHQHVNKVWTFTHPRFAHIVAEDLTKIILLLAAQYTHILAPATTFGKNMMPRVAALLDVSQISDVCAIESPDTFVRPIYAGNAFEKVRTSDAIKILTIRPTAFEMVDKGDKVAEIATLTGEFTPDERVQFKNEQAPQLERPELSAAKVVIAGGRGLKSAENFKLLEKLADKLGAAIGATRAAVDAGFVPNDFQVGQTGKVVAPQLYIAIGISGAIQHLAGMKDSKIIVAINKDKDAPIFQVADYGLVGDLFEILPQLEKAL